MVLSSKGSRDARPVPGHVWALAVLLFLFILRVAAQLVQAVRPTPRLPPFAAWQSGTLPYPALLAFQAAIIGLAGMLMLRMSARPQTTSVRLGMVLLAVGGVYMTGAALRLAAGLTILADHSFFGALIPGAFHLVLAAMVLVFGHYQFTSGRP